VWDEIINFWDVPHSSAAAAAFVVEGIAVVVLDLDPHQISAKKKFKNYKLNKREIFSLTP
jgi:hypothetical protein